MVGCVELSAHILCVTRNMLMVKYLKQVYLI